MTKIPLAIADTYAQSETFFYKKDILLRDISRIHTFQEFRAFEHQIFVMLPYLNTKFLHKFRQMFYERSAVYIT